MNALKSTYTNEGWKVVDFSFTNKILHLELASDVCNLFQPEDQPIKPYFLCNGLLALEIADGLGAFAENPDGSVQKIVIPAPVEIDSSGRAFSLCGGAIFSPIPCHARCHGRGIPLHARSSTSLLPKNSIPIPV